MNWKNTEKVLNDFGKSFVEYYQSLLLEEDKVASGDLFNSVRYIIDINDNSIEVSISLLEYWKYIEHGRRSGTYPPIKKIEDWIIVKKINPYPYKGKIPTIKQLSYLISRKIYERGVEPNPLFKKTTDNIAELFKDELENAVTKDVTNNFNIIIKDIF